MSTTPAATREGPPTGPATAVVVIDDDASYARLVQLVLEEDLPDGSTVLLATSVREAIAVASGVSVGCVVLDLSLVDVDAGFGAIDQLRAGGLDAPVLILSGRTTPGLAEIATGRGAAGFLVKGDEHGGALARAVLATLDG